MPDSENTTTFIKEHTPQTGPSPASSPPPAEPMPAEAPKPAMPTVEEMKAHIAVMQQMHPAGDLLVQRTSEGSPIVHEFIGAFIRARDYADAHGHGNVSATMVRIIRDLEVLHVLPAEAWTLP